MNNAIKQWAKAAGIRAAKTAAQTAVGVIGASTAMGDVSWTLVASAAALAAIVSVLTSIAGIPEADEGSNLVAIARAER